MTDLESLLNFFVPLFSFYLLRYFFVAGLFYYFFYVRPSRFTLSNRLQKQKFASSDLMREIGWSIGALACIALSISLFIHPNARHFTTMYDRVDDYGWPYFIFSIVAVTVFQDFYFYWTHRLIHHPVFIRFHGVHHRSRNPSPFASFTFHPVEAVLTAGFLFIVYFTIPIHLYAQEAVGFIMIIFNVAGHSGLDIPNEKAMVRFPILRFLNTSRMHNDHHRTASAGNYGLYFSIWDRLFKTYNLHLKSRSKFKSKIENRRAS